MVDSSVRGWDILLEDEVAEEGILEEGGSVSPVPMMAMVEPSLMPYAETGRMGKVRRTFEGKDR